jgi:transposase
MGSGKQLTPSKRSRICALHFQAKWTYQKIHLNEYPDVPISTIKSTCQRERKRGRDNLTLSRSGRPRKLSEFDRDLIFDYIQQHPRVKYHELLELVDFKICEETLRLLLKDMGMRK